MLKKGVNEKTVARIHYDHGGAYYYYYIMMKATRRNVVRASISDFDPMSITKRLAIVWWKKIMLQFLL